MEILTSYTSGQDEDGTIGDQTNQEVQNAQGFQIQKDFFVPSVDLYLKNYSTPPTDPITVRIETSGTGPSGTLVQSSATTTILASAITGSYQYVTANFPVPIWLLKNTQYYIVCSVPAQSTDVRFLWGRDATSGGYTYGNEWYKIDSGAWTELTDYDFLFKVNGIQNSFIPFL